MPKDIPTPKGNPVRLYSYADANLYHNKMSGKAVTAILHFINKTPFDWFTKTQAVVNTATFGAESTAARTALEHPLRLCNVRLRMIVVSTNEKTLHISLQSSSNTLPPSI